MRFASLRTAIVFFPALSSLQPWWSLGESQGRFGEHQNAVEILTKTGVKPTPPVVMNFLHPPAELSPSPLSHVGDGVSICRNLEGTVAASTTEVAERTQTDGFIPLCSEASSETSTSNMRSSSSRSHDSRLFRRSCRAHQWQIQHVLHVPDAMNASAAASPHAAFQVNLLLLN